jgi:hypothetical protein
MLFIQAPELFTTTPAYNSSKHLVASNNILGINNNVLAGED